MGKLKTRKAAAKRFRATAKGKILRRKAGKSHLLEWKSSKRKRGLCQGAEVSPTDVKRVRLMVPGI